MARTLNTARPFIERMTAISIPLRNRRQAIDHGAQDRGRRAVVASCHCVPDGLDADSVLKRQRDHHRGVARYVREICAALASIDKDLAERAVIVESGGNRDRL